MVPTPDAVPHLVWHSHLSSARTSESSLLFGQHFLRSYPPPVAVLGPREDRCNTVLALRAPSVLASQQPEGRTPRLCHSVTCALGVWRGARQSPPAPFIKAERVLTGGSAGEEGFGPWWRLFSMGFTFLEGNLTKCGCPHNTGLGRLLHLFHCSSPVWSPFIPQISKSQPSVGWNI